MPTYEYECQACGHKFEQFQSITAKPIRKCPDCGKSKVQRLIGAGAGLIFKGTGFYQTDYRSASYNDAKNKESGTSDKKTDSTAAKPASESKKSGGAETKKITRQTGDGCD